MKIIKLCTVLALFSASISIHAATLASGNIYGGTNQALAACYLFNSSNQPVTVNSAQIFSEATGAPITTVTFNNCVTPLNPGATCVVAGTLVNNGTHACKMVTSSATGIRGNFEVRNSFNNPLRNTELR